MSESPEALPLTVHGINGPNLGDPAVAARGRTSVGRLKMLLVLLVCAAPVIASYFTYFVIRPEGRTNYSTLIEPMRALPALSLRTLDGTPVAADMLRGQWLLVVVGPSTCDEACDKRMFMQRQLREMLGRERDRIDKLWLVTDDAAVPAPLRQAIDTAPAVTALRVPQAELAAWLSPAVGHALEDHLYLIDPMGQWMMRMPADAEPGRVKRDLEKVLRASASWDKPGREHGSK